MSNFCVSFITYSAGINALISTSKTVSKSVCSTGSPFNCFTASFNILQYRSYPTAAMCPCWTFPSRFPAPRISKSFMAILKPLPKSVNSLMASNLFWATSFKSLSRLYIKKA